MFDFQNCKLYELASYRSTYYANRDTGADTAFKRMCDRLIHIF